ncbi:hypothetical protein GIB67_013346 [Kingdonia uniflora]|uniref:Bifunctional inhibitor/plant lipid transfer protein/seed storage helical domain-containing protein n=1 Tax=Kingdonia uniflora TaxID=39325 RepID=A0A7J7LQQ8_9MAGN|nr:hypothetical protein GIB67_013346 [Kingdonia uniflora]
MAKFSSNVLVGGVAMLVLVLIIAMQGPSGGVHAVPICNMDSDKLSQCLPAIQGSTPSPPTKGCCDVMRGANMRCLCQYKMYLPALGINSTLALALPQKCGMPPQAPCSED